MGVLDGKVAVVTGGTRGLGLAICRAYIREGAAVVLAARSAPEVERAVTQLKAEGAQVSGAVCDVGDLAQVEALGAFARERHSRFDVWVNNAGITGPYGPTAHIAPAAFEAPIQTIVFGTYHGSLVALREFLPRGAGKLINMLGWGARGPVPFQNAYAPSKGWVRSFTSALATEYRDSGVGIYALNPGMMRTDLLTRVTVVAGYEHRLRAMPAVIRMWANPPEVPARKAVWLASPETDGRTGLQIDQMTRLSMLVAVIRDRLRQLAGRPAPAVELTVTTVAPAPPFTPKGETQG